METKVRILSKRTKGLNVIYAIEKLTNEQVATGAILYSSFKDPQFTKFQTVTVDELIKTRFDKARLFNIRDIVEYSKEVF